MNVKKILSITFSMFFIFTNIITLKSYASYMPPFDVECTGAYLLNLDTNTILYEKDKDRRCEPASLVKMMTAIIVLEKIKDIDSTTATAKSYIFDELFKLNASTVGIVRGETLTIRQLLQCMLTQSACEASSILADAVCPDNIPGFIKLMNMKAKQLGANNTHFTNPHGLYDKNQYTTAYDMATIAKYGISLPVFMEICSATSHEIPATNKRDTFEVFTTIDPMRKSSQYYYSPVRGIKTGTLDTGRSFVSIASKDGFTYLCSILEAPYIDKNTKKIIPGNKAFELTNKLYKWGFEEFKIKKFMEPEIPISEVKLKYVFNKDHLKISSQESVSALVPKNIDMSDIKIKYKLPKSISAPVNKGEVIGTATLTLGKNLISDIKLVSLESVSKNWLLYFGDMFVKLFNFIIFKVIFIILLFILIIFIAILVIRNKNKRGKKMRYSSRKNLYKNNSRFR